MAGDGSASLPPVGQTARLHVAGKTVPVEVFQHVRDTVELEVVEEGWRMTDGEARLVHTGPDGGGLLAGTVRVLGNGHLLFTPGSLRGEDPDDGGEDDEDELADIEDAEEVVEDDDIGQRRESFRVDMLLDVVVAVGGRELPAKTINVSPTGCLVHSQVRLPADEQLVVRLPVEEDRKLPLTGRVVRDDGADRYAVQFAPMDAAQERQLTRLLAQRQREILRRR